MDYFEPDHIYRMKNKYIQNTILLVLFSLPLFAQSGDSENVNNGVELKNLTTINSEYLEFSPMPYKNGLMFTSSRGKAGLFKCPPDESGKYSDLFFSEKDSLGGWKEAKILKGKINGKYHDGVATFASEGEKMFFSRNNMDGKNEADLIDRKIYEADMVEGTWTNITELPFNSDDYSTCHPALSADGKRLYFSSNMTGTLGGMDIFVSEWQDTAWGTPRNLGSAINTIENEIFPFIDANDNLYFSSDGHPGSGGLDIFAARKGQDGEWGLLTNMGSPFNTYADDLAFSSNSTGTEGYFASNREGGLGLDDIYSWTYNPEPLEAIIIVYDEDTGEELEKVPVVITPTKYGNTLDYVYGKGAESSETTIETNEEGSLTYGVAKESEYHLLVEKEGYIPTERQVSTHELIKDGEYRIPIRRDKVLVDLDGLVVNKLTNDPIPLAGVEIINTTTGEKETLDSDGEGSFRVEIDCKHNYVIKAYKPGFTEGELKLNDLLPDCKGNNAPRPIVKLKPRIRIVLEGVYFDFDKSTLRPEGKEALNEVVTKLNKYQSLEVLLTAHTDSRGSDEYNFSLSDRRAKSAIDYIIEQGIAENRLSSKGYGETQLVNECSNGVPCSKEKHQQNRRVELEVTNFEEEDVDLETEMEMEKNN